MAYQRFEQLSALQAKLAVKNFKSTGSIFGIKKPPAAKKGVPQRSVP